MAKSENARTAGRRIAGIAGARERKASEIAALTTENARRVFGLRA